MEEKRLSIRFRMDNEQDRKAWDLLQRISDGENTSKNAVALRLICKGAESIEGKENTSLDEVAEKIAELVSKKIVRSVPSCEVIDTTTNFPKEEGEQEPQTSELRPISEEVLSFLDGF